MASLIFRGRSLKSGRSLKRRRDSDEDAVKLDLEKAPHDNIREILLNVSQREGVTKGRCLSYLSCLVKISKQFSHDQLGFSMEEIFYCLRVALFHEAFEVRAAGHRAIRHLLKDQSSVEALCTTKIDYFICRSLDIVLDNRIERVQAMRLCRKILCVHPERFPESIIRCLVSLAKSGLEEKDPLLRACLGSLGELALLNPTVCADVTGVIDALLSNILLCSPQQPQLPESLLGVVLFLLNHPLTRTSLKKELNLERLMAPITDGQPSTTTKELSANYFQEIQDRETRMKMSQLALVSVLHSWPGFLYLCSQDHFLIKTLVDMLALPYLDSRRSILELLYDLFALPQPEWTTDFDEALLSADSCAWREGWQLYEGFVAAEGRDILPHLSESRPNLVENFLALLLLAFVNAGVLESLVEVVASDPPEISVFAIILLGELLHLANRLLPPDFSHKCQSLPSLVALAISHHIDPVQKSSASSAVSRLDKIHLLKKRGPVPASLFLDHLLQRTSPMSTSSSSKRTTSYSFPNSNGRQKQEKAAFYHWAVSKAKLQGCMRKETDDVVLQSIKDTQVLTKSYENWDWALICSLLKSSGDIMKKLDDASCRSFIKILMEFFKPSTSHRPCFSRLDLSPQDSHLQEVCFVGCHLVDFLLEADESKALDMIQEFLSSLVECLIEVNAENVGIDAVLSPSRVAQSCQFYFLFIGYLSAHNKGKKLLESSRVFELLLEIVGRPKHDAYVSLVVSSFDYTKDEFSRTLLNKVLTAASDNGRLYATKYLRVLLRASVPDFRKWGIELLINQLYDKSQAVSLAALHILEEACELRENLESLIAFRPSLLHLGERGLLLLLKFLSLPSGFKFLNDANFINCELEKWNKINYLRYVKIVESSLNEAFSKHRKGEDGTYERRSNMRYVLGECFLPPHMYGQLCHHQEGFELITRQLGDPLNQHFNHIFSARFCCSDVTVSDSRILETKASLWTIGNVAMTPLGLRKILQSNVVPAIINLASEASVLSIRGTCFYVLGLIGTTADGADYLSQFGWEAIRRSHHQKWPVLAQALAQHKLLKHNVAKSSNESLVDEWMYKNLRYHSWSVSSGGSHISEWLTRGLIRGGPAGRIRQDSESSNVSDDDYTQQITMVRSRSFHTRDDSEILTFKGVHASCKLPPPNYQTLPKNIYLSCRNNNNVTKNSFVDTANGHLSPPSPGIRPRSSSENPPKTAPISALYTSLNLKEEDVAKSEGLRNDVICEETNTGKLGSLGNKVSSANSTSSKLLQIGSNQSSGVVNFTAVKSRSGSCTDSTTSGVSSCDLGASDFQPNLQNALGTIPSSASLNTLVTFRRSVSNSGQPVSSMSSNIPSMMPTTSSFFGFTTARDARGYATLRAIQRRRRVQSMSSTEQTAQLRHSTLSTGFLEKESNYTPSDKESVSSGQEDDSSDVERSTSQNFNGSRRSSSQDIVDPMSQTCPDFYLGLCLPVNLDLISLTPVALRRADTSANNINVNADLPNWLPHTAKVDMPLSFEDDGLEFHNVEKCFTCSSLQQSRIHKEEAKPLNLANNKHTPRRESEQELLDRMKKVLLRKEALHFITNLSSSVGIPQAEQGLLSLKQKFPQTFNDSCLYSEICLTVATYNFRLSVRRFLQELFMEVPLKELTCLAEDILLSPLHNSVFLTLSEGELLEESAS